MNENTDINLILLMRNGVSRPRVGAKCYFALPGVAIFLEWEFRGLNKVSQSYFVRNPSCSTHSVVQSQSNHQQIIRDHIRD